MNDLLDTWSYMDLVRIEVDLRFIFIILLVDLIMVDYL